jgi:diguanylate cyclase (GGDEF)-like protein
VAIAIGFGLLLYTNRNEDLFPGLTMTLIAFALAGLVSMRQLLGQRDLIGVQAKLSFRASHDGLTGLPNRTLLFDRLGQALARRSRGDTQVAVLLLDVDDFKEINDTLGHAAGDELLMELANRLRGNTRGHETVARLGGDEFALVAEGTFGHAELVVLAERLLDVFAEPFTIAGAPRRVRGSLGIVRSNGRETTADELLRDADTAMYRTKSSGKGGYDIFDRQLRAELVRHVELRAALERALRDGKLDLHYQPIVDTASGRMLAVEALCRWRDERFGDVGPEEFIPLAERCDLIVPLGRAVLAQAIGQLASWRSTDPAALPLGIFVNVSAGELRRTDYCQFVLDQLGSHGLRASDLAIELTERALIDENEPASSATLAALATVGVRLVLDDFGSGYSALASLNRFPLAALKLDQLFTAAIGSAQSEVPITRAVVALGAALGLLVIAEGVETPSQLTFLKSLDCPAVQGYLLGRPQSAPDIEARFGAGPRQFTLPPRRSLAGRRGQPAQAAEVPSRP